MDWQGQKFAEWLMQVMLLGSAVAAFVVGYLRESFQDMLYFYAGGCVLTMLVTVPNWPFFNRHPLKWLDPKEADVHGVRVNKPKTPQTASKKPAKSSKK